MEMKLAGQNVVVFGAARGIGAAIVRAFVEERAVVHGFDRSADPKNPFPGAALVEGDVTVFEQVRGFAETISNPDHVVFCVGVGSGKFGFPFWNLSPNDWARVLEINLIGAVNVAHAFAPRMAERGLGSMLFLVSVAGQIGSPTDPPYSAAKAGLINFVQCAAKDLAPFGVRVNALSPGMVKTDLNESVWRAGQERLSDNRTMSGDALKLRGLRRWDAGRLLRSLVRWPFTSPRSMREISRDRPSMLMAAR
jgi:NAD(P)-dependent dehydrogenase (short-subunit alcohol dehydrogenase family)